MKNITKIYITILFLFLSFSCQEGFLDQVPDDRLGLEETFSHRNTLERFLANIYSQIPDEAGQRFVASSNAGPWTGGSDEAEFVWGFVTSNNMNIGAWDATSGFVSAFWSNYYRGIRSAGDFLENADKCVDCGDALITQYKAEARALRAIYYYYLMRMYGPIVIMGDENISPDAQFEDVQLPRSSMEDCVAYIAAQLDQASENLPIVPSNNDSYGRITKGFAQAIKAEALLLSASPLFNGNTDYADMVNNDGKQLISQTYEVSKWRAAADAYKAFIDEFVPSVYELYRENDADGNFSPYLSCRDVMLQDWNSEIIFARVAAGISSRQYELTPFHSGSSSEVRGSGGLGATQNMVDAYFTSNGRSIDDPASGYQESGFVTYQTPYDNQPREIYAQWANREPRFYVGITFDGSTWLNTNTGVVVTETHYTGNSGRAVGGNDYSPTGYIVRKGMALSDWRNGSRSLVLLRLANIYLGYAEALNEADPGNPDILNYLNLIRERAGVPEYGTNELPAPSTQEAMREAIHKERRVELAFENVRYFDTRRWKVAETTDNGPIYGLDINAQEVEDFYNRVSFEDRTFNKRHYLFPIPQDEVNTDKELIQNTGW
ncbi:RagB/SusD family nutrient uptake outer membrane protein [Chondrinema litorale]|uniref:RagB/SusD family nutrient uptake outer membrane protein n=1 Tax=Chondrinema litorale TaxID=2994555 RepID=UPI0025429CC0|nr:RagB/SusD family nutrient uptake outer membrane protein [Chondrinema litorale]UZR96713.1 RagB/SusD family nutrient uptake outer membrane protein [Chondrinema litorale]